MLRNIKLPNVIIKDLKRINEERKNIVIQGFVKKVFKTKNIYFVRISDSYSDDNIKAVIPKNMVEKINVGTSLQINGEWLKCLGDQQEFELQAKDCKIYAVNQSNPIQPRSDVLMDSLHLRPNCKEFAKILKLRSKVNFLTHKYFHENNFTHIDTPFFSLNDCEGGGETFIVKANDDEDFFGESVVNLPVSGQLHLEACAGPMTKVYTINGAFRAEKSLTRQHMAEFRMLEVEIGFCDDTEILCNSVEDYIRYLRNHLLSEGVEDDIKEIKKIFSNEGKKQNLIEIIGDKEFPRVKYDECVEILKTLKKRRSKEGFNRDEEFDLLKHFNSPLFIINFPASQKPFYMKKFTDNGNTHAKCFDFITPTVGELAGGSVREDSIEELKKHNKENIDWYMDLRKHGYPTTGGYGIGVDRLIQSLFSISNIKNTIPFPRYYKHCKC
uniref:Probable asparagine--tRNA ligase, mitochondrial (inferred by orthology to a human protein) n=1 Tax=Strongyloides venezuelensis TaxID=75913 RepID=A0A0K0EZA7_STRVS